MLFNRVARKSRTEWASPYKIAIAALCLFAVWAVAIQTNSYQQHIITLVSVYAIIGSGLVLLVGAAGQFSLGQAAFVAVGAYAAVNLSGIADIGLPLELAVAIVIALCVGIVIGLPSLRLSGLLLAVATLALGYSVQGLLYIWKPITGGSNGKTVGPLEIFGYPLNVMSVSILFLGISFLLIFNILSGRTGRALHAIRTSDIAARSVGIDVGSRRVTAFALSAAMAAVGGTLYAHSEQHVSADAFSIQLSISLVVMVLIGGQQRLLGALLGSAFVIGMPQQFREMQKYEGIIYGGILLACIVFAPNGLVSLSDKLVGFTKRIWVFRRSINFYKVFFQSSPRADEVCANQSISLVRNNESKLSRREHEIAHSNESLTSLGLFLSMKNVEVKFGGVVAVSDVSLDLAPGEVLGLIGPNGAGKTTLFNALSGMVGSVGTITFGDTALSTLSIRKRALAGVARTFQNLALHQGLSCLDHILIGADRFFDYGLLSEAVRSARMRRSEEAGRQRAFSLLAALGLRDVADSIVDELPYGLQKRVDVGRALASRPRLLLLDEPSAGLPHFEADEFIDQVLQITAKNGTSVIIIEHNIELVQRVCARIVVLSAGAVIADGESMETLKSKHVIEAYLGN